MKKLPISALFLFMSFCVTAQSMYDNTLVTKIEIYFSTNNWDQLLDNYYAAGLDERLLADSVVINGNMKDSVGVKYKGNSTYNSNNQKIPLTLLWIMYRLIKIIKVIEPLNYQMVKKIPHLFEKYFHLRLQENI